MVVPLAVRRYVRRLDADRQRAIAARLRILGNDPYDHAHSKSLHAKMAGWRSSDLGNLRIIFSVEDAIRVIDIIDVGPRGDIYKR